jgi:hypothetical protein
VAKLSKNSFEPFDISSDESGIFQYCEKWNLLVSYMTPISSIDLLKEKLSTVEEMFDNKKRQTIVALIVFRIITFVMMYIGLISIFLLWV